MNLRGNITIITDIRKSLQNLNDNNYTAEEIKKTQALLIGVNNRFI